jgi:tripartite-type tricarboxylate transporter receptor subunit TctC
VGPNVSKNVSFDVLRDLAPVGLVAASDLVIGVHPSVPAKTIAELIAAARAQPGKLSYSSCGNGTILHLAGELLKQSSGVDMTHVPYRGCGPAIQDSASGQVPVFVNTLPNVAQLEKQGRVRMLAIASARRSSHSPDVPTVAESGIPGYEATSWYGFFAPAATPRDVIARLSSALTEAVNSPDVRDRIRGMLYEPRTTTPDELSAMLRTELARWAKVAKSSRIEID